MLPTWRDSDNGLCRTAYSEGHKQLGNDKDNDNEESKIIDSKQCVALSRIARWEVLWRFADQALSLPLTPSLVLKVAFPVATSLQRFLIKSNHEIGWAAM